MIALDNARYSSGPSVLDVKAVLSYISVSLCAIITAV